VPTHQTLNPALKIPHSKPQTPNVGEDGAAGAPRGSRAPLLSRGSPHTLHPTHYTPHPSPYALHPTPFTLRTTPCTLHPEPFTLHPTPFTLRTTTHTLHPDPSTPNQDACAREGERVQIELRRGEAREAAARAEGMEARGEVPQTPTAVEPRRARI